MKTDGVSEQSTKKKQPFLVEESSRVTVQHISDLMQSDYLWSCIALVAHVATEAERVGSWSEGCPCEEHQPQDILAIPKEPRRKRANQKRPVSETGCPLKCCHAPELAVGLPLEMQSAALKRRRSEFAQHLANTPPAKQSELQGSFAKAIGLLWGHLSLFVVGGKWEIIFFCPVWMDWWGDLQDGKWMNETNETMFNLILHRLMFLSALGLAQGHLNIKLAHWKQLPWLLCA